MHTFTLTTPASFSTLFDPLMRSSLRAHLPLFSARQVLPCQLTDHDTHFELVADLPSGTDKDQVDLQLNDGVLTISIKNQQKEETSQGKLVFNERQSTEISRRFGFDEQLATEGHSARLEEGRLFLSLQKRTTSSPTTTRILIE